MSHHTVRICLLAASVCVPSPLDAVPRFRQLPTRRLPAVETSTPPTIDGQLDDEAWRRARHIDHFVGLQDQAVTQRTEAFVCHDTQALYVAFRCYEAKMDKVVAAIEARDGPLWTEDCVEVFIDAPRDRRSYFQIETSPRGAITDKRCLWADGKVTKDAGWNCQGLRVATSRQADQWCVEAAIPFASLGEGVTPAKPLGLNLTRCEQPHQENSSWARMSTTFHSPREFGVLVPVRSAVLKSVSVAYQGRKTRVLRAQVQNGAQSRDFTIDLEVTCGSAKSHADRRGLTLGPRESAEITFRYPIPGDQRYDAKLSLLDVKTGKTLDAIDDTVPRQYFAPSDAYVTLHTKWAKPLVGGPLRVLFITPYFTQRDVVELAQRIDLDARVVSFLTSFWDLPDRPTPDEYLELIRRELSDDLDAIVIDRPFVQSAVRLGSERHAGVSPPLDIIKTVQAKVAAGTGLILFTRGDLPPSWEGSMLKACRGHRVSRGKLTVEREHFVTRGVPFDAFVGLGLGLYDSDNEAILRSGSHTFLSEAAHDGGRVLVFGNTRNGVVAAAQQRPTYRHWDYYHAFFARCLVWASRRESSVRLASFRVEPQALARGGAAKVLLSLRNTGNATAAKATFRFRDPCSREVSSSVVSVALSSQGIATCDVPIPGNLAHGLHFADVVITANDKVVEWGSATFDVRSSVHIGDVSPESTVLRAGDVIRGHVRIATGRSPTTAALAKGPADARRIGKVQFVPGRHGQALIPGAGRLEYATDGNMNGPSGTVAFWVALSEPKPGPSGIRTNWWWRTPHALRLIHYPDDHRVSFQARLPRSSGKGGAAVGFVTREWQRDEWHHVACTWATAGLSIYVDGELKSQSKSLPGSLAVEDPLRIGHIGNYGLATDPIDDFCVYGRALTAQEVAACYEADSPPHDEALLLHLPFDAPDASADEDYRLRLRLRDRLGRLVAEKHTEVGADAKDPVPFALTYPRPLARSARVEVSLLDERGVVDEAESPWIELAERRLDDFLYFCWDWRYSHRHPDYVRDTFYQRLREQGVDGVDGKASLDFKLLAGAPFPAGKRHVVDRKTWYDVFQELKSEYARTQDKEHLVRHPCLSDPKTWSDYRRRVASAVRPMRPNLPIAYGLGDENTITFESSPLDLCFSEHCLRDLREWLRQQYGTLQELNASWQMRFASWQEVLPMTAEEVRGRGSYAPWIDHRTFMSHVFARAHERSADALRSVDPTPRVSTSGTRPAYPYSACDWWQILPHLDHLMPYSLLYDQGEVHRSFSRIPQMMCSGFGAKGPYQRYLIWYAALHGSTSLVFSKVSSCVASDLSVHPDQPLRTAEMRDLQEGLGKALMLATRQHDGIAIHYSPASVNVEWIAASEDGKKLGYESPAARNRRGWLRMIEALGLQYQFLSYEQVERGDLMGYRALIMPYSQAVSKEEAAAIRTFVERGGTLIGDYRVGTFDEHGVPQQPGLLDDVFGIGREDRVPQYVEGQVRLLSPKTPDPITDVTSGPGLVMRGAKAFGTFESDTKWPAVCTHELGRGVAHYLNFLYDYRASYRDPTTQPLDPTLRLWAADALARAGVKPQVSIQSGTSCFGQYEVVRFRHGAAEYVCVLRQWKVAEQPQKMPIEIAFSRPAYVCDVRERRALGRRGRIRTEIGLGEARVSALLPYEVTAVRVSGPERVLPGGVLRFRASVDAAARQPGEHVLHVDVIGPDGKARRHYACNLVAEQGVAEGELTLALNDPSGKWRLLVRDIASGKAGELAFHVEEHRQIKTAQIDVRSAWEVTGIVEELRNEGVAIPTRVEELQWKVCREINLQRVHESHEQAEEVAEMTGILSSLPLPEGCPAFYPRRRDATSTPVLPVLRVRRFLEDRVLGVGLKSYPYVIDWNADGKQDLLVGDHDGFIYVYLNEGTAREPKYGRATRLKSATSGEDFVIHFNPKLDFADLAGDSKPDLVVGSHAGVAVLFENVAEEDGHFAFDLDTPIELRSRAGVIDVGNYGYPELTDWDGDGTIDLLMGEEEGEVHFFKGVGRKTAPRFYAGRKVPGVSADMYPCPEAVDWDYDGLLDLVLGGRDGTVQLFLNDGTRQRPSFTRSRKLIELSGQVIDVGRLSHPHVADWNGDGLKDLIAGNDDGDVLVWRNVASDQWPQFDGPVRLRDGGGELVCGVHPVIDVVDWNGDGRLDLLAGGETERVRLYLNVGARESPKFDGFTFLPSIDHSAPNSVEREYRDNRALEFTTEYVGNLAPEAVDWNGDGRLDLLLGGYTGLVRLHLNQGGGFSKGEPLVAGDAPLRVAGFSAPVVADWNGDSKKDLICGDFLGRIHVFTNAGTDREPAFGRGERLKVAGKDFTFGPRAIPEVADYNGDGRQDVLVGNRLGKIVVLLNVGTRREPRFDHAEYLRDDSDVWRELYGGAWACPRASAMPLYRRREGGVGTLDLVATSCPRVVDWDGDGKNELIASHRFGRIFVFERR